MERCFVNIHVGKYSTPCLAPATVPVTLEDGYVTHRCEAHAEDLAALDQDY